MSACRKEQTDDGTSSPRSCLLEIAACTGSFKLLSERQLELYRPPVLGLGWCVWCGRWVPKFLRVA